MYEFYNRMGHFKTKSWIFFGQTFMLVASSTKFESVLSGCIQAEVIRICAKSPFQMKLQQHFQIQKWNRSAYKTATV